MRKLIQKAVKILNSGGIVIFPTDTAFGIGCRIDMLQSVVRLFELKKRPLNQAVPVLASDLAMAEKYLLSPLPNNVRRLMNDYWPGALTVIYNAKPDKISPPVAGVNQTLGIRIPNHDLILKVIRQAGVPLLGPSANFHGKPTPYKTEDLDTKLTGKVDLVIGGKCPLKQASTVIDCSKSPWKIVRQGSVTVDERQYQ